MTELRYFQMQSFKKRISQVSFLRKLLEDKLQQKDRGNQENEDIGSSTEDPIRKRQRILIIH